MAADATSMLNQFAGNPYGVGHGMGVNPSASLGASMGPGFGQPAVSGPAMSAGGDLYGGTHFASNIPMMPPPNPEMFLHGLASSGRAGVHGGMDAYGNPVGAPQALGGSAMGMAGHAANHKKEPTTLFGKFFKKFYDLQMWIFMPGLLLFPAAFIGKNSAGGSLMARLSNGVGAKGLTGWKKPMFGLTKLVNNYDKKMWDWGTKISNTVKNKWGLKAKPGSFLNKLWTGGINLSGSATSKWGKALGWLKSMGQPVRNAAPAVANAAGKIITKFSLRSVLTGLGFAGPLGWITGALALGLTAFSLGKKLFGGGGNQAQLAQQQQLMAMQSQGSNPYGQVGYGMDPTMASLGANPMAATNPSAGLSGMGAMGGIPSPMDAYHSLNMGMPGGGGAPTDYTSMAYSAGTPYTGMNTY